MHSSFIKSCLLALATASTVVAQTTGFDAFTQPLTPGTSIAAGSTYTIKWTPSSPAGQISITLLEGASNTTLQLGPVIAKAIESVTGSYDWPVPTNLTDFPYFGFKLSLDSDPTTFQYSTYFSITGLSASGSSTSSGAASTVTSASTTVTRHLSQVGPTTSASTSTISATLVTVNSTSTSTPAGIFQNSTKTTTTSKSGATSTASTTSASASSSSGAVGSLAVGGTGLLGALLVSLGMLL